MPLILLKNGERLVPRTESEIELNKFCEKLADDICLEWRNGQYWLHSDLPKERPIGVEIDSILTRHEEFFKKSSLQKELLARAIGVKGPFRPKVLDLTAGLLGDALLMLAFGCEVTAVERHPIIFFLLESAVANASHPRIKALTLIHSDASSYLAQNPAPEVIYFDPMFEDANERTSPRKEMRIFRGLIGSDQDALEVWERARAHKPKRLVVKRPRHSSFLGQKPAIEFLGKSTRYDVYFSL